MRGKGIPARFVTGKMYLGSYHAWAEIWLEGEGWVLVEAQSGKIGVRRGISSFFFLKKWIDNDWVIAYYRNDL